MQVWSNPSVRKIPWRRKWQPIPVFLLGNPMDRGAWPARGQRLAKSRTQLSDQTTYFFTILEDRDPRLRCQQVWFLPETALLGFQVGIFSLCLQVVIAVCVHVSRGFPGGSAVKNSPANAGDAGSIPGSGRSPRGGNGNPCQYSCLENLTDRRA